MVEVTTPRQPIGIVMMMMMIIMVLIVRVMMVKVGVMMEMVSLPEDMAMESISSGLSQIESLFIVHECLSTVDVRMSWDSRRRYHLYRGGISEAYTHR